MAALENTVEDPSRSLIETIELSKTLKSHALTSLFQYCCEIESRLGDILIEVPKSSQIFGLPLAYSVIIGR